MKNPTRKSASDFHHSSCVTLAFEQAAVMRQKAAEAHMAGMISAEHYRALTDASFAFREAINAAHAHVVALDAKPGPAPTV